MASNQQRREAEKRKLERQLERRGRRRQRRKRRNTIVAAVVVVAVVGAIIAFATVGSGSINPADDAAAAPPPGACSYPKDPEGPARPVSLPTDNNPPAHGTVSVTMVTNQGVLPLKLDRDRAPCTVGSFEHLAAALYFDNTPCHRLVTSGLKVLQCGDPTGKGTGGPGYTVPDEPPTGLAPAGGGAAVYPRGVLAMANTGQPNSGGSQFFLVYGDSPLPPKYTVFGTVDEPGIKVLEKIAAAGDDGSNGPGDGKPKLETTIQNVAIPTP